MKKALLVTSLLIVSTTITTAAIAENVYKCSANTYSQIPCLEGVKLATPEAPDSASQRQADQATARDANTADRMEKARLKQERRDLKTNTPSAAQVAQTTAVRAPKAAKPKDFVAEIPGTGKAKATQRKSKQD
jgi:flagellum-specific peptidoglycan hydrolase FlgJ